MVAAAAFDQGERRAMLEALYRAFNARDLDAFLAHVAPGVDWPDETTGGRLYGRDAVRQYWQEQWQEIDPTVEPMRIEVKPDGTAHVLVDQLVRSRDGEILQNRRVEHVYDFDGAFIGRMTIIGLTPPADDQEDDED